jgi:hypothetical protein
VNGKGIYIKEGSILKFPPMQKKQNAALHLFRDTKIISIKRNPSSTTNTLDSFDKDFKLFLTFSQAVD